MNEEAGFIEAASDAAGSQAKLENRSAPRKADQRVEESGFDSRVQVVIEGGT
jgi:hypothetical protein